MKKIKEKAKKILCGILVLALTLTGFHGISLVPEAEAASSGGYTELTFSDWGIVNGAYGNGVGYSLKDTSITTLDKTAFTGKFTYNGASDFRIGGNSNAWAGLTFMVSNGHLYVSDETDSATGDDITLDNTTVSKTEAFELRLTFDKGAEENKWTVGIYVNGEHKHDFTDTMNLGTAFLVNGADMTLEDVKTGEEPVELTNLTWADFDVDYEAYTESAFRASTTTTSLVNTSFRGKVKFLKKNTASGSYYICYAANGNAWDGMRIIPNSDGTLKFTALTENGYDIAFSQTLDPNNVEDLDSFLDTQFELGIDMTASGDDLEVSIYINGALYNADPYIWTGAVTSGWAGNNANFIISQSGDSIIAGEKPVLKDITTADFGITYDTFKKGETFKSSTATAENLLNTSFRGQVLFNKTNEDSSGYYYRICYAAQGYGWDGMNIIPKSDGSLRLLDPWNSSRLDVTLPAPEEIGSFVGTEYELGVDLWAFRDDAKVNIYINGKKLNDTPIVWTDAVKENLVGNNMNFILNADGDSIVMGVEPPLEQLPSDFMTITANDFGIVDGNDYWGISTKNLAINGDASLDRKILNMNVAVSGVDMQLFYGRKGSSGDDAKTGLLFRFTTESNQILLVKDGGWGAVLATLKGSTGGFDLSDNNSINLKITTEFVGNDVKVGVFINEVLYNNQYITLTDYKSSMNATLGLSQNSDSGARMIISTPKQYMPNTFRHLTFNEVDLGAEDYNGAGTSSVAIDWDMLLFSGKVQLKNVGSEIRFGAQGGWVGYRLEMTSSGLALIWDAGSGGNTIFTCPEITADTTFTLTLATEYVDVDSDGLLDDLKFGFWINGNMYGNRWFYHVDYQLNESAGTALSFCMEGESCRLLSWKPNTGTEPSDSGKRIHSLTEGGYLLSGEGTITVNGEVKTSGTVLNTAGDYTIVVTDGSSEYTSTVILWERGDAHPDGKQTAQDLVAIKKVAEGMALSTESGQKGADITKDGNVNVTDVEWMREVLIGTKTLDGAEIPAVSFVAGDTKVMPIAGFWGPTTGTLTDEVYQKIKESGINLVTWSIDTYGVEGETANVMKQLELAEKNDISLFVRDSRLNNASTTADIAAKIADYSQYASFRGLTIVDEPGSSDGTYGSTERALNNYATLSKNIDSFANLNAYTNLLPLDTSVGTEANYKAYLNEYCSTYNPKVLSYDNYPFNNYTVKNCSNYFKNLSIIRDKAAEYKIPFWTFVQAGAWGSKTTITEAQMKWNLNMNLAFGAKGIQYFPMVEPTGYSTYDGKGMITESGETTEYYTYIKNLNQWIATVDDVLMNSESKGIMTTGYYANKNIKENGITTVDTYGKVSSIATNETAVFSLTNGAVAGCFDYNGKTAVYVVNYDVSKAHTITLGLTEATNYRVLKNDGETDASGTSCAISLGAGEAALVVLD